MGGLLFASRYVCCQMHSVGLCLSNDLGRIQLAFDFKVGLGRYANIDGRASRPSRNDGAIARRDQSGA